MKIIKSNIFLIILMFYSSTNFAQINSNTQIFQENKYNISPAYVGFNGNLESFISHRQQWVGIDGSPKQQSIDINGALGLKSGIGFRLQNENTGNMSFFIASSAFSHKIQINDFSFVSFGLSVLSAKNQLDLSKVVSQGDDPVLQENAGFKTTYFDIGTAVLYNYKNIFAGIYIPEIFSADTKYKGTEQKLTRNRNFNFHINTPFSLNNNITLNPNITLSVNESNYLKINNFCGSILFGYKKRVWTGVSLSSVKTIGMRIGGALTDNFVLFYSYEFGFLGFNSASVGSHSLTVGFLLKRNLERVEPCIFPPVTEIEIQRNNEEEIKNLKKELKNIKTETNTILKKHQTKIDELQEEINNKSNIIKNSEEQIDDKTIGWQEPELVEGIKFGTNSDKLFSSSFAELNKIVNELVKNPAQQIKFILNSEVEGSQRFNMLISENRAKSLKDYLKSRGIENSRIIYFINTESNKNTGKVEIQFKKL